MKHAAFSSLEGLRIVTGIAACLGFAAFTVPWAAAGICRWIAPVLTINLGL
jgi:hypothetical protein